MKTTQSETRYAILKFHQPANGRSYYQAKDAGCITCRKANMWTTTDRDAAIHLAGNEGGTVVTI